MSLLFQTGPADIISLKSKWGWLFFWGVALIALGIWAISYAYTVTIVSMLVLGAFLAIAGVVVIFDSFYSWWGRWPNFLMHLAMGALYAIAGVFLMEGPVVGSLSITFLLAVFYIVLGAFRVYYAIVLKLPTSTLRLLNGVVTLILGVLILAEWPLSGFFIIGLFIGIDLVFSGWVYILTALSVRKATI